MTALATLLWVLNVACDTAGHLSFKAAATVATGEHGLSRWSVMLAGAWIWIGVAVFAAELFLWLAFLSLVPLSLAVLMGSVDILAVAVGGRILFGEPLTLRTMFPTVLIAVGVALVGWC